MRSTLRTFLWLALATSLRLLATAQAVTIQVDAERTIGPHEAVWSYFGADEPNYSYAPGGRTLLRELAQLSPAPVYIRLHNLLTTGDGSASLKWGSTNVYREDATGRPVYDWTITDHIFDALKDSGTRPLVEVGFMPEALSTHAEPYRHSFPNGSVFTGWSYPPKDYAKWSALVTAWTEHLHQRYGDAAVSGWLWEVWNEPDIDYWHGTPEEYDKLYDVTAAAIQKVLPAAKIGGPEATGVNPGRSEAFLRQFLEHCAHGTNAATGKTGAPLAFISFHPKGSPRTVGEGAASHVEMDVRRQLRATELGMKVVASYPEWKKTPIILGESDPEGCAACKGPQNGYRNGPLYGVSVVEATALQMALARRNGVTLQGAVTWAFEFEDQPLFAGFRELATSGVEGPGAKAREPFLIDKPVLNVFRMMGMMSGDELAVTSTGALSLDQVLADSVRGGPDVGAVGTRGRRQVEILVWNYHDDDVPAAAAEVKLAVSGIPAASVTMERFLMDQTHSNAYGAWQQMGSPPQPSAEQVTMLQEAAKLGAGEPVRVLPTKGGAADLEFALERQAVTLVRLSWVSKGLMAASGNNPPLQAAL